MGWAELVEHPPGRTPAGAGASRTRTRATGAANSSGFVRSPLDGHLRGWLPDAWRLLWRRRVSLGTDAGGARAAHHGNVGRGRTHPGGLPLLRVILRPPVLYA